MSRRPPVTTNLPAVGSAGAEPPPNAPREVSQPLKPDAGGIVFADGSVMTPLERARQNEQELKPLVFDTRKPDAPPPAAESAVQGKQINGLDPFYAKGAAKPAAPAPVAAPAAPVVQPPRARRIARPGAAPLEVTGTVPAPPAPGTEPPALPAVDPPAHATPPAEPLVLQPLDPDAPPPLSPDDLKRMPAASNSDSPGRGQVRNAIPPGKEITGGFGMPHSMQYFALTGIELRAVVETLMDQLHARIQSDIRFQEHICYPRVSARVVIEVEGFAHDDDFTVGQVMAKDHPALEKTPLVIARQVADEVCFVLLEQHREVDEAGESVTPPDQVREELGLPRPAKRQVGSGANRQFVDTP